MTVTNSINQAAMYDKIEHLKEKSAEQELEQWKGDDSENPYEDEDELAEKIESKVKCFIRFLDKNEVTKKEHLNLLRPIVERYAIDPDKILQDLTKKIQKQKAKDIVSEARETLKETITTGDTGLLFHSGS